MNKPTLIQIGEYGKRIGETHGRAKLSDHEIDLVRQLKEEGMPAGEIAEKFEVSKRYVYKLVNFERRASIVAQYRRVVGRKEVKNG
jgi:transposase